MVYIITYKIGGKHRIMAHHKRIITNGPNHFQKSSEDLIRTVGIPTAKRLIDDSEVSYTGLLRESFVVDRVNTPSGNAFALRNIQPYAIEIETGNNKSGVWVDSTEKLDNWREKKGIYGGDNFFVTVGSSGGGNRVKGKPFPLGVHFMEGAYGVMLNKFSDNMHLALDEAMR